MSVIPRLQVRLVEAGKRELRAGRHEQRVEELVVSIERLVTRGEVDGQLVGPRLRLRGGHDDMAVFECGVCRPVGRAHRLDVAARLRKIQHHPVRRRKGEADGDRSADRSAPLGRNDEGHLVAEVCDCRRTLPRERFGHARLGWHRSGRSKTHGKDETEHSGWGEPAGRPASGRRAVDGSPVPRTRPHRDANSSARRYAT